MTIVPVKRPTGAGTDPHALASAPFLANLRSEQIRDIVSKSTTIHKPKGSWIFRQGEPATYFYLLLDGRVNIHHITPEGSDVLLRIMAPLEIFGYRCINPNGIQVTSVQATRDSWCLAWPGPTMRKLFFQHPQLAINAFEIASAHMFEFEIRYRDLATEPVEKRIARILLDLAGRMGRRQDDVIVIESGVLQKDIGQMTGASVFSVSRIFAAWRRGGILRRARGRIVLRDLENLRRIAAGTIVATLGVLTVNHTI